jgi:hypothetical protein
MRTYGRITNPDGSKTWVVVQTDANGYNDMVWLTTLIQTLKLNLGESPFYAQYGIPAQQSVIQQVFPDYYVALTQQVFSPYFASLVISKTPGATTPSYQVNVTTHQGVKLNPSTPIPQ